MSHHVEVEKLKSELEHALKMRNLEGLKYGMTQGQILNIQWEATFLNDINHWISILENLHHLIRLSHETKEFETIDQALQIIIQHQLEIIPEA